MAELSMDHGDEVRPAPKRVHLRLVQPEVGRATGGDDHVLPWYRTPLLLLLSGPTVLALVLLDTPAWVRAAPVLAYIAVVPGLVCVRVLRLPNRLMEIPLGIGLSVAVGALVAQAMIYLQLWSPIAWVSTLVVIASPPAAFEVYRGPLSRQPPGDLGGGAR
jgi:hypothetical protein